jgi:mannose-6-phosphate isomerase
MWHILRAEPGARLALGFSRPVNAGQVRQAALDKTIEELLGWCEPAAGDTYLTPAGTVHALGGGLVLCEIQQDSDVTYRLYDYDRGRPLHLDKGLQVTSFGTHPGKSAPILLPDGGALLARCPYFVTERYPVESDWVWPGGVMIVLEGRGSLSGENGQPAFQPGEVWNADEGIVVRPQGGAVFLRTYAPV